MNNTTTIIIMLMLVTMSAFFSATETAFSSLSLTKIKISAEQGNKKSALILKLLEDYDKLLSTILVGNNIVNIGLSSIATVWFIDLIGSSGATVSTIVITIIVLIFGEITPKSLAKESPESFCTVSNGHRHIGTGVAVGNREDIKSIHLALFVTEIVGTRDERVPKLFSVYQKSQLLVLSVVFYNK